MGQATTPARLRVENVGGIAETAVELSPGVTVLSGRNATNRTSLLRAITAAVGSDDVTVKGDAEEGRVELAVGDRTYTRRLRRRNGTIVTEGDPYLEDATLADLFAFLLESNDARRAVVGRDDLREIIMRPVDTDAIEAEIADLDDEREELGAELEELRSLEGRLPDLEGRRADLEAELAEKREALDATERRIDDVGVDLEERRTGSDDLEATLEELNDVRGRLETVRRELEAEEASVEALEGEREELSADREASADVPEDRIEEIDAEIRRRRRDVEAIEATVDRVGTVIGFNEDLLDGSLDVFGELRDDGEGDGGPVTDRLLEDGEELVCWTCGSEIETGQVEAMLDRLREVRNRKLERRNELADRIDELEDERAELEERRRQRDGIDRRLREIDDELRERESRIEELRERRGDLTEAVEALEADVETHRSDAGGRDELLELHKEANRLEVEIERLEEDLESVDAEIDRIDERVAERDRIETRREEIRAEIEERRTRVGRLEAEAVESFNEHMDAVLDRLGYENLERIWIERAEREVREGRRTVIAGRFDLHVVRSTASGAVYEDTVEHLSESEREVTGLVFALAGYLAHEVHETVPFMLLDSLEALDAERIASLVEYFGDHADYLVVALLPEDAAALDPDVRRISEI